ncbi:hypothetical protein ICE93_00005, partial [Polynucleobacter sp. MWH-HuK1]|nr:hypothetical protein [Polynucleobacter sp. MWH-HuK1]
MAINNTAPSFLNVGDGITGIQFGGAGVYSYATNLATLPNGNILAALSTNITSNAPVGVALFDANGNLVLGFGNDGVNDGVVSMATTSNGGSGFPVIAVDEATSTFVLAGHQSITKYNFDGTKVTSFGSGGTITENLNSTWSSISAINFNSAGKLIVTHNNGTIARFNSDGSVDNTFGTSGTFYASNVDISTLQADGKILTASWNGVVTRYNENGSLDNTFVPTTVASARISSLITDGHFNPSGLIQDANGKILVSGTVGGSSIGGSYSSQFALARFNADGSLDTSFGGTGIKSIPFASNNYAEATSLDLQPDGKILIGGMSNGPTVVRLNSDGSFDTSFGSGGTSVISWSVGINRAWDIALQADGKILVSGDGNLGSQVVRLTSSGVLDTSFSANPIANGAELNDVTYRAGTSAIPIAPAGLIVSDSGLAAQGNFAGSSVTLARNGGANSQDVFSTFGGRISALNQGGSILLDGESIGTVTQNSAGTLSLLFNSSASQAEVNTVLNSIAYSNSNASATTEDIRINWVFSDGNTSGQGSGGALSTNAYTTIALTSAQGSAPIYVDLTLNQWERDSDTSTVRGGPNGYYYNSSDNSWSSQFYRWPDPTNPSWITNRVTLSQDGNSAILPPANQIQKIGQPLSYGYWENVNGINVQQPTINDLNADLGMLRIHALGSYPTAQLDFAPWVDANTLPTYFSLTADGAAKTVNWVSLPAFWDYNESTNSSQQITGLKAKVVAGLNNSGNYDLLIGHFDSAGNLLNDLTGAQMSEIFRQINLIDTSTTPLQAAYSFNIQVSNNAQLSNLNGATWYGASGPGQADKTTVYYDTLAPVQSKLYVAETSMFLAMNGTGTSSNSPGNVAQSQWQGVVDAKLLPRFTATVDGVQVDIVGIKSQWNGYELNLAKSIIPGKTVSLTYTPPAGSTGINQLDGVIQDEAGNDAAAFTISGVASATPTSQVTFANYTAIGFTNDENSNSNGYFSGGGLDISYATKITLVSFASGRAVFQFDMPSLAVGNPKLDGVTINGASSIYAQFEVAVDLVAGTNPYLSGIFTGVGQSKLVSTIPNGMNNFFSQIDPKLAKIVSFKNTAIGDNGSRQLIETNDFNGVTSFIKVDDLSDSAALIGNDTFYTGAGNDTVFLYGGNDTLISAGGSDTIDGGFGIDTVSFSNLTAGSGLHVMLADLLSSSQSAYGTASYAGINGQVLSRLTSIENVVGSNLADVITGNQANNILDGGSAGQDSLFGAAGDDTLIASLSGNNYLDGGDGRDTAVLTGNANEWSVVSWDWVSNPNPSSIQVVNRNTSQVVTISSTVEQIGFRDASSAVVYDVSAIIQNHDFPNVTTPISPSQTYFVGTSGNDFLIGNNLNNTMLGLEGSDTLRSGSGNDSLDGGSGSNILIGSTGNDVYLVNYTAGSTAFTGNFDPSGPNQFSNVIIDSLGIDTLRVTVNQPSTLSSSAYLNIRRGGVDGADFYVGLRDGSQSLAGQDAWFGKTTIAGQYEWNGIAYTGNNTVENLQLSGNILNGTVNIALGAGSNATSLLGTAGADFIAAFGSGNTIIGGAGNDFLTASRLDTQEELDVYNLRNVDGVTLDANSPAGVVNRLGTLLGDSLFGGDGNDDLNGYYGNDYLDGGAGIDLLRGWEGNDTYVIDNAGDSIEEKTSSGYDTGGIDTIITSLSTLDLRATKYDNVENLTSIAGAGLSTTLYGDSGNNVITGGAANDTIDGISGVDTISGGSGNDTIVVHSPSGSIDGGEGIDTLQIANDFAGSAFSLGAASINSIENLEFIGAGNFIGVGNTLNNTITSG